MQRFFTLFALLVGIAASLFAQTTPTFSTADNPVYYRILFDNSKLTIEDKGANAQLLTAKRSFSDNQLFAFIGNKDKFTMLNKSGRYVSTKAGTATNGQSGTFLISTTQIASATSFALVSGSNGRFHVVRTSDKSSSFNQWGGAKEGMSIGFWNANDAGNLVRFVSGDEVLEYPFEGVSTFAPERKHTLWYNVPAPSTNVANVWMEYSLPIGNGILGASLFGGIKTDEIQFNEKSLWEGKPSDMQGGGSGYGQYLNFGSVFVENLDNQTFGTSDAQKVKDYVRYLDIEQAIGGVNFTAGNGTKYTRRYLSSQPAGVIVARYSAEGSSKLSLRFSYAPGEKLNNSAPAYTADGSASFAGKLQTIYYNTRFQVVNRGGTRTHSAQGIEVKDADEVLLILGGATTFDGLAASRTTGSATTVAAKVKEQVDAAAASNWDDLLRAHTENFESYMGRVSLNLNNATSNKNTEELVKYYNASAANKKTSDGLFLEQLYFNYGRYLSISSSRGDMRAPNNLQGIWNDKANAPWNSDIHTNINVQMNYWPVEPTNLSECHLPLLNYIMDNAASANWKKAAKVYGKQDKGWTVFTESTIFGGMSVWGNNYFVANAWYCSHLWQHYRYTLDKEYLKRAFPAMWSSAEFWMGRMIKDRGHKGNAAKNIPVFQPDGTWVCPDEYSAEQNDHPTEDATAHAQQLVTENLKNCMEAIEALGGAVAAGISEADYAKLKSYYENIDKGLHTETYTGKWGAINGIKKGDTLLREWKYAPYSVSNDQGHRHMSHLMCLYPLSQVEEGDSYFQAAVNSLKLRGDIATGWSMGWKVNLWARAKDGDHAHKIINNALRHSTSYGGNAAAGGVYYNLFDSHAPFQIDGNFGVCSGIAEMLLQSHRNVIELLPALPTAWTNGSVTGLKAVGNFTVDVTWQDGKATAVKIVSHKGAPLVVKSAQDLSKVRITSEGKELKATPVEGKPGQYAIPLAEGKSLEMDFTKQPTGITLAAVATSNPSIYDLSGRRANAKQRGVLVVNGKKVVQ